MEQTKIIVCPDCGAEYEDTLPKCPYCGQMNYKGAEAEYLDKLEDVREKMSDLVYVPEDIMRAEIKKQGHLLRKIIIIIIAILVLWLGGRYLIDHFLLGEKSEKEQFLWQGENFPKFDELYESGKYEELAEVLSDELLGEYSIWDYEHRAFAFVYGNIVDAKNAMEAIDSGENTSEDMYVSLLYNQVDLIIQWGREGELSDQERDIIEPLQKEIVDDFYARWKMSDEDYEELMNIAEENYHVLPYDEAKKYVKKWLKKNR